MWIWKILVAVVVAACLSVFILQNREILELRFLLWTFVTRRAHMILVVFGMGLATGWIMATISQLAERGREASTRSSGDA